MEYYGPTNRRVEWYDIAFLLTHVYDNNYSNKDPVAMCYSM